MDMRNKASLFVILIICIHQVSGVKISKPENLLVNILDGDVTVMWKPPADAPPNSTYNVQMAKYIDEWALLAGCTGITNNYCDLSTSISEYHVVYKIRVQLVVGDEASLWTVKKFMPNDGVLQPPSFTMWTTSTTLTINVHQKSVLKKLFPFGLKYTVYLEEKGQNKNTTAFFRDGGADDQRIQTFTSLRRGKEYCVSIMVQGIGALSQSSISPKQCLHLPVDEWFIIAVASLSVLGVMSTFAIAVAVLLCYLKSPRKTPAGLKSPVIGWRPLSVEDGPIEVVTDKGWFLSGYRTDVKHDDVVQVASITSMESSEEEDRRTITDSGVSVESGSVDEGSPLMTRKDSGCGSMGSSDSSACCQMGCPLENGREDLHTLRKIEDRGVGSKLGSSSMNLDERDSEHVKNSRINYHSQSPSSVQTSVCDDEKMFTQIPPDSNLPEMVKGYRAGLQSCIFSGEGQCTWCHKQGHCRAESNKQYRPVRIEDVRLESQCGMADSDKGDNALSGYARKNQMDSVLMDELGVTFLQLSNTLPLMTAMSALPLITCGQDFNVHMPPSLCDVQLQAD
ncbi:unnamed protein product [Ophioblennius macclurei]